VETHWDVLLKHEKTIKRVFSKLGDADELFSDVAIPRSKRILELFDENKGASQKTWLIRNLYLYARKHVAKEYNRTRNHTSIQDYLGESTDNSNTELVSTILGRLSKFDATILYLRHYQNLGFKELGELLGVKRGMARLYHARALDNAKLYLSEQGIDEP